MLEPLRSDLPELPIPYIQQQITTLHIQVRNNELQVAISIINNNTRANNDHVTLNTCKSLYIGGHFHVHVRVTFIIIS